MSKRLYFIRPQIISEKAAIFQGEIFEGHTSKGGKAWHVRGDACFPGDTPRINHSGYSSLEEALDYVKPLGWIEVDKPLPEFPTSEDLRPYKHLLSEKFIETWNACEKWGYDHG